MMHKALTLFLRARNRFVPLLLKSLLPIQKKARLVRIGSLYGGWVVPDDLTPTSICYSAGLGEDASFDLGLIARFGCPVYAFDPTPRAIEYGAKVAEGESRFNFYPYGLWDSETELRFYAPRDPAHVSHSIKNLQKTDDFLVAPVKRLSAIMKDLGHDRIDLLKLDIEGAEYEVLNSIFEDGLEVGTICVEFDQPVPVRQTMRAVRRLRDHGYVIVAIEGWNFTFVPLKN